MLGDMISGDLERSLYAARGRPQFATGPQKCVLAVSSVSETRWTGLEARGDERWREVEPDASSSPDSPGKVVQRLLVRLEPDRAEDPRCRRRGSRVGRRA